MRGVSLPDKSEEIAEEKSSSVTAGWGFDEIKLSRDTLQIDVSRCYAHTYGAGRIYIPVFFVFGV